MNPSFRLPPSFLRSRWLALAVWIAATSFLRAQSTLPVDEEEVVELAPFVVTGERLANRNAIAERQGNLALVDAVGADDLGNLPDQNLGEALGRMAGVSTIEDEGVGRYATIRGLNPDYVNVTMDGSGLSAAVRPWDVDTARGTNLQAISPDIISKVQVFKTVTPDLDGSSIGGTINLVTRSAYDASGSYLGLKTAIGTVQSVSVPTIDPDPSYQLNAIYSDLFGENAQFGLVLNASTRTINRMVLKQDVHFTWANPAAPANPTGNWDAFTDETATRQGAFAKFEFRPSELFYAFAAVNYFDEQEEWKKNEHILWRSGSYNATNQTFSNFAGLVQPRQAEFGTDGAVTYSGGLQWKNDSGGELSLGGSKSSSAFYLHDQRAQWIAAWGGLNGTYVQDGRNWDLVLNDASAATFSNPQGYYFNEFRNETNRLEKDIDTLSLDWASNMGSSDQKWGYQVGAKYSGQSLDYTESYFRGDRADRTGFNVYKYADDLTATDYRGSLGVPLIFASLAGVRADIAAAGLESYKTNFQRWRTNYANAVDYQTDEEIYAGYAMGRYAGERFATVFGVRFEQTDWSGRSRLEQQENAPFVERSGSYDHYLPSVNATYRLSNAWNLRAGYNMAVGRPKARNLVPFESNPDFNVDNGIWRLYRSNPDLQPRVADNLDLAAEYYFDQGNSLFTFGFFFKDIADEIYDLRTMEQLSFVDPDTGNTITAQVDVTQPQNAGSTIVRGFETSLLLDRLRWLPGPFENLGLQLNYTYLAGEMDLLDENGNVFRSLDQLQHQPEQVFNAAVYYEGRTFSVRLAAKHSSGTIYTLANDPLQDLNQGTITRYDLHAEYRLTRNFELFLDVANLTKASTFYYGGPYDETVVYGRTLWLGLKAKF